MDLSTSSIQARSYLLEVGSKTMHVLVIGQKGVGFSSITVDIPDAQHGQQDGHVLFQGGSAEVVVLLCCKEKRQKEKLQ